MKIYNFEQQTDEWFKIRQLKVTGSKATSIAACGAGLDTCVLELVADYFSSGEKERFSNKHTERGNELEPIARSTYELITGNDVEQIGFAEYNQYVGCSPDGLVGDKGMIEIKCYDDKGYFNLLMDEKISTGYIWQMQMNMLILERDWCDFIVFNPNYEKSIYIKRIFADKEKFEKLRKGFVIAEEKIKELVNQYNKLIK